MKTVRFTMTPPSRYAIFSPSVATGLKGTSFVFIDLNEVRWQAKVIDAKFVNQDTIDLTLEVPDEATIPEEKNFGFTIDNAHR